jgi:hypothetical protein
VGSCESASGGCVSLLSSGSSERESAFIEATPDGSGVFFETAAQLLPQDTDTAFDIYDARVCSELSPCLSPPAPEAPACAEAQTCRPAEPVQAIPGVSPASRLAGAGNLTPGTASQAPQHGVEGKKTVKPPTRAQKLARALARCHKRYAHEKRKRKACEKSARRRYGYRKKPSHATTNNATSRKANKSNPTGLAR